MLRQAMITLVTAAALSGGLTADAFALAAGGFGGGAHIGGGFGVAALMWAVALAGAISAVPWVAVASAAACAPDTSAADASREDSSPATVSAAWSYPSGTMTIGTAATAIMIRRLSRLRSSPPIPPRLTPT